jgi:hypothetical protein
MPVIGPGFSLLLCGNEGTVTCVYHLCCRDFVAIYLSIFVLFNTLIAS